MTTHDDHLITPDCPVDCLKAVISLMAFNRLARAYRAPFEAPRTVRDVAELYRRRQLGEIWGLGPRRIGEIHIALALIGIHSEHPSPDMGTFREHP